MAPRQRAKQIIELCAHPRCRPLLQDYLDRAIRDGYLQHAPHRLGEALSWHQRFIKIGDMRA